MVDLDALFAAVTGLPWYEKPEALMPLMLELREHLLRLVERHEGRFMNAWVIAGAPTRAERERLRARLDGRVVILETDPGECLRRIAADPRRAGQVEGWRPLVAKWWGEYERGGSEERVVGQGR